jgi:hypothetical protein
MKSRMQSDVGEHGELDGIGDPGESLHVNGFGAFVEQFLLAAEIRLEEDPDG